MIFCFSGNGNTRFIATKLADILGHKIIDLKGRLLTDAGSGEIQISPEEDIIWMFPIYSWGIPPVVRDFISKVKLSTDTGALHHMVATMGDDSGLTDKMWRRLIAVRGWKSASAQGVIMPNTYVLMKGFDVDKHEIADGKLHKAIESIPTIAQVIRSGKCVTDINRGSFAWIKSRVIYPWFVRYSMSPRKFTVHDCISCGKCVKCCPMDNIRLADGTPQWGDRCAMCLGCYNVCPRHAIEYASATTRKGQYHCPSDLK